jgi:glycosyltransferase involved in cell wall biosynthesis
LIQVSTGGAERVVLDLARNLDRSKFNIHLAFFFAGALEKDFREVCHGVFRIPREDGFDLFAMWHLSRIIAEKHIDVVNAHHYMPFFYSYLGCKILHKRKLIYTEHSVAEVESILSGKHKNLLSLMLRNTDGVVGVSREIAETLKKVFPRYSKKIYSIVNGLDVDRFVTSIDRNKVRSRWGILPEHFVIGTVANFRKVKNHACLILAFNRLSAAYPHARLLLVGEGTPMTKKIQRKK